MVPAAALDAWAQQVPWPNELDIEQDLVLSRLIIDIANHPLLCEELAFRGGTALHKLHAAQAYRYSNDLDYVRCTNTPAGPFMDAIREVCLHMGLQESSRAIKQDTLNMKFDATPTTAQGVIRVKIETNTRETTPWKPRIALPLSVTNPWFTGTADVLTFELEELLGTKLRALHQRRKGRDLFDLWLGLTQMGAEPQAVVGAFNHYLEISGVTISASEMRQGLLDKVEHRGFAADLQPLVREIPADYDLQAAAALVDEQLVQLL